MRKSTRAMRKRRRWQAVLAVVGGAAASVLAVAAVLVASGPSIASMFSAVSDGVEPVQLVVAETTVEINIPPGWVYQRLNDATLSIRTPDGGMSARVELLGADSDSALRAELGADVQVRRETLASGLLVEHADRSDHSQGVVAVVRLSPAIADPPVVLVTTGIAEDVVASAYRPALAQLLEEIAP